MRILQKSCPGLAGSHGSEKFAIGKLWVLSGRGERAQPSLGKVLCRMSPVLALNERPQGINRTVALFCVIRLEGELGQRRRSVEGGELGGAKSFCSPGTQMWFQWSLANTRSRIHSLDSPSPPWPPKRPSPGQPLGGIWLSMTPGRGGLNGGDGECGTGRTLMTKSRSWNHFYLSHALVQGEQNRFQQYVLWGSAQANFT